MNKLSKKLSGLEQNTVSDEIDELTTHLDFSEFPDAERELHRYVRRLLDSKGIENLSLDEKALLEKSVILLCRRVFGLFMSVSQMFCMIKEKSGYEDEFNLRFGWFMAECLKLGKQSVEMQVLEHENAGLSEDDLDAKICELEAKQPELFTEESFNQYERRVFSKMAEKYHVDKAEVKA